MQIFKKLQKQKKQHLKPYIVLKGGNFKTRLWSCSPNFLFFGFIFLQNKKMDIFLMSIFTFTKFKFRPSDFSSNCKTINI